jgi:hypothetical protein
MNILKNVSLTLFFLVPISESRADVFDQVVSALQSGDMAKLESYFAPKIELQLADGRVFFKNTEEVKKGLSEFIKANPAQKVQIKHRGPEGKQGFVIANYLTKAGVSYRLTIYMEGEGANMRIKELKFENS